MLIFGPEAARRYHAWAGASADLAASLSGGGDDAPRDHLPRTAAGSRSSASDLEILMDGVAASLPRLPAPGSRITGLIEDGACVPPDPIGEGLAIVGLTGRRRCGKTVAAEALRDRGAIRGHPFAPGKAMLRGYYVSLGASEEEALAMTDGHLKDVPSRLLDGVTSRLVMEVTGAHMGRVMGPEWTLGVELRRIFDPAAPFALIESVAYEERLIRSRPGSAIIRLEAAPGRRPPCAEPDAPNTDAAVSSIAADATVLNRFDGEEGFVGDVIGAILDLGIAVPEIESPRP